MEGLISGRPYLLKKTIHGRKRLWDQYVLQSAIRHPFFIPPDSAWFAADGSFRSAMPLSFSPGAVPEDLDPRFFAASFLSLAFAMHERGYSFRWSKDHLVFDEEKRRALLAGFVQVEPETTELEDNERYLLASLQSFLSRFTPAAKLVTRLKAWERRRERPLAGCLAEILQDATFAPEMTMTRFEWKRRTELELLRGLLHLASRGKGQSVLFHGEEGAGKSVLRRHTALMVREAGMRAFEYAFSVSTQPYAALRSWIDHVLESAQATNARWLRQIGAPGFTREVFAAEFLASIKKLSGDKTCVFLLDDLHHCDPLSLDFLSGVLHEISGTPVLFVLFSQSDLNQAGQTVSLPLDGCSRQQAEESAVLPFWQAQQRRRYIQEIHARTSGNPLLFNLHLEETLRLDQDSLLWSGAEWTFRGHSIPSYPDSLSEFYRSRLPLLSEEERDFLRTASLQGKAILAELVEPDAARRELLARSLTAKGILHQANGLLFFHQPLVAEALSREMEDTARRALHAKIAGNLEEKHDPRFAAQAAAHFLKAGFSVKALDHACAAAATNSSGIHGVLLELEADIGGMTAQDQLRYFRVAASVFARTGRYSHAVRYYAKASELCAGDFVQQFSCAVQEARCRILNNDILAAHRLLQEQESRLAEIHDPRSLMNYHFAKATVQRHRGSRENDSFENAVSLAEKLQDHESLALSCQEQAELAWHRGKLREAKSLAEKAVRYALRIDACEEAGNAYKILGSIATRRQQPPVAIRLLNKSLRMFLRAENRAGQARVWNLLGNLYLDRSQFAQSIHAFQNALALFGELDHPLELGLARFNLGRVFMEQGRFKEAESVFTRCASSDRKAGNKRDYAFDLRALAVACLLQGHNQKASRLLKRTVEIFSELQLENEILQTRLLLIHNELEQGNEKPAALLLADLERDAGKIEEPQTRADIFHLVGRHSLLIKETGKALANIQKSLRLSRKCKNLKLSGQNLILLLIARGVCPAKEDISLARALRLLKKGGSELEAADAQLLLYRAYPELVRQSAHKKRLMGMLELYRKIRHRKRLQQARALLERNDRRGAGRDLSIQETWPRMLEFLGGDEPFESRLKGMLALISQELGASSSMFQFLSPQGIYERFTFGSNGNKSLEDLRLRVLQMMPDTPRGLFLDFSGQSSPGSAHSVVAVPVRKADQISAMWCFERNDSAAPFTAEDFGRASFFLLSASPVVEAMLAREFTAEERKSGAMVRQFENLIGAHDRMRELYRQMENVGSIDISVLISGESGTGKELVARSIHGISSRSGGAFVALNCSAIPETLLESELFGFSKGAFTGATQSKPGVIERANGGTLFLDEIGDLSLPAQAKLLRVIQEKEIRRLGETATRQVDVRFLFATHKDLKKLVKEGGYREDLYYRISSFVLCVPPLRERGADIATLLEHFAVQYGREYRRERVRFTTAATKVLSEYSWPGNVREMENLVQTLLVNSRPDAWVDVKDLPDYVRGSGLVRRQSGKTLEEARHEFEREFLLQALKENRWNKTQTAKHLQITRQGLIHLIQRLGIQEPS